MSAHPFPPALEAAITESMKRHAGVWQHDGDYCQVAWVQCLADKCEATAEDLEEFAAHQAAVVMEAIAQHAPLEFSVSIDGVVPALQGRHSTMESALAYAQANNEACNGELRHAAVARPTFPWQEIAA